MTAYYGYFEVTSPSSPGMVSNVLAAFSFLITAGLVVYGLSVIKKFKQV